MYLVDLVDWLISWLVTSLLSTFQLVNLTARVPGFEPGSKVLETSILPLNYTRRMQKLLAAG